MTTTIYLKKPTPDQLARVREYVDWVKRYDPNWSGAKIRLKVDSDNTWINKDSLRAQALMAGIFDAMYGR